MSTSVPRTDWAGWGADGATLGAVGEAEVLRRLLAASREYGLPGLELAAGDDAAVWRPAPGHDVALSQDAVVEGKDFLRAWTTPRQLGRKAVATALSDLAGMGARPAWCSAALCAASSTALDDVLQVQLGICDAAAAYGCALAGGDISDIDGPLVITLAVGGTLGPGHLMRRDRGKAGDALVVTGVLGRAAAGLEVLRGSVDAGAGTWVEAQLEPRARVAEGLHLAGSGVECGGDISDGLCAEAGWLAAASGCAAEIWEDAIPVDPELREVFGRSWLEPALGGGEDYELLAAVDPGRIATLIESWPARLAPLSIVGRLAEGSGVRLLDHEGGDESPLPTVRSRHYR